MIIYLDTSSLIKLYHEEDEADVVDNILAYCDEGIYLSELAALEYRSAIWKKFRTKDIDEDIAQNLIEAFQDDHSKYLWIKIDQTIITSAIDLLAKYGPKGLRTLDSIQFASALALKERECIFITFDDLLKPLFPRQCNYEKQNIK